MTMLCSRCHTHKYDPITHTEYYELMAFFNSTAEGPLDGNKYEYAPVIKVPRDQVTWNDWQRLQSERDIMLAEAGLIFQNPQGIQTEAEQKWNKADKNSRLGMVLDKNGPWIKSGLKVHETAKRLVIRIREAEKGFTTTLVAKELDKPRETKLLQRGEYNLPTGDALQPDVLNIMGTLPEGAPRNRLGLALSLIHI